MITQKGEFTLRALERVMPKVQLTELTCLCHSTSLDISHSRSNAVATVLHILGHRTAYMLNRFLEMPQLLILLQLQLRGCIVFLKASLCYRCSYKPIRVPLLFADANENADC